MTNTQIKKQSKRELDIKFVRDVARDFGCKISSDREAYKIFKQIRQFAGNDVGSQYDELKQFFANFESLFERL